MDAISQAADKAVQVEKKVQQRLTVLWHEVESWQQDNQFIISGYRPTSNSYAKSAASLGYLHNQSVNIYSHLIGAVVAIAAGFVLYQTMEARYESATTQDLLVFACFFLGAAACLGMSATYHTLANHSQSVSRFSNQLDYLGIVFLIWGSFIPSIYYGFQERPQLIRTYWTMITTISAGCAAVSVAPFFAGAKWRPFRAAMFVAMGLSAVFPVFHGLGAYGIEKMDRLIGLKWLVTQGALYILGAGLYAARVPERYRPGTFDIWGASHQIFHMLVLLAAAVHLVGLVKAFDFRHSRVDLPSASPIVPISWW
ncbi:HlyIII-domain-containing protein [Rhizodiscina lignyota]|uniref:HlyIII-domain-containing protein n=1 Tax=Rhizodiscina lignyota TaxID=1504668 RepID=A0A9P4IAA9_9PEZI|nr:HlyIII-domain-containing protein [Rhizodiscina lignyota]